MQKIYVSAYRNYTLQVKAPILETTPDGTVLTRDNGKAIQFNGGRFVTDDVKLQEAIEASSAFGADVFDLLSQENQAKAAAKKMERNSPLAKIVEGARHSGANHVDTTPQPEVPEVAPPATSKPPKAAKGSTPPTSPKPRKTRAKKSK